ncbi:hypothetical protein Tco_0245510 [Tanacetum coccineum]
MLEVEVVMVEEEVPKLEKECLDGWVRFGGGEVKGGGDDFGVSMTLLGEIPGVIMGKSSGETFKLMEEPIDSRWVVIEYDKEGTLYEGWRSNKAGH